MQHPDEGTIHAWIDGELSRDEATALEMHLAECAECSASAAEARGLVAASSRIVSALDIVPGGVIPAARAKRQPWYASTQLRAAAAIAIVAGASMLVMRDQKEATMDSVRAVTAPAPATAEADMPVAQSAASSAPTANAAAGAAKDASKEKAAPTQSRERRENQTARKVAESPPPAEVAASAPPPPAMAIAAPLARSDEAASAKTGKAERDSAQRMFNAQLSDVVVTGVATESAPALKELRSDSSTAVRQTTYEAWPGIEVVLTDAAPVAQRRSVAAGSGAAASTVAPRAALKAAKVNSISWTDKRGHTMTLSGPVSRQQLESIRKLLPEDKR